MALGPAGGAPRWAPPFHTLTLTLAWVALTTAPLCAQPRSTVFTRDVAPILYKHCVVCHRDGEVGGFSLLTYEDARPRAAALARATRARRMPPWMPAPINGVTFVGQRGLTNAEIETIERWADWGAPEGSRSERPAPPAVTSGWRLGTPDLVVAMPEPYVLAPGSADVLRNVVIPVPLGEGRYVRGLEFRPDNGAVVHHANIRVDRTRSARAADATDIEVGFDGRISAGAEFPSGYFLGWTPGQLSPLQDDDTAWQLDPGSDLVVQLHLRPTERTERVQVRIGFFFSRHDTKPSASKRPRRTPVMIRLGRQNLDIPADTSDHRVEDHYRLPVDVELAAIQPHAHHRARSVVVLARLPDDVERTLLDIPEWSFDWQDQYRYTAPIVLPAGTELRSVYHFDNSVANRRNPDHPPRRVRWGQSSSDEMGDVWFQVITRDATARAVLTEDVKRKVLAEDAVGYETMLEREPGNARLHEAAATLLLALGQHDRAADHLEQALRLNPGSAEAHYNLGTALAQQGRADEAIQHLREVVSTSPNHVPARVNLGALLRGKGDLAGAATHLQRALALDGQNAAARANLGGVLLRQGHVSRAMEEYRVALAANPTLLEPLTELAWSLATSPHRALRNPVEAIAFAEQARQLTNARDVRVLDALAASYAAANRFGEATRTLEHALRLVPSTAPDAADTRRLLSERLALYRARQPYVDKARR
ncbi:MAG: tetratricopeptide repeat protein [Acidimicrobiia bacterium]|nr:tetratricopeptide repeat protein [Acidimicrobiia bacterium]